MAILSKIRTKNDLWKSKRQLAKAERVIERKIDTLKLKKERRVAEIKRAANTADAVTENLARKLVKLKKQIDSLQGGLSRVRALANRIQEASAQASVLSAIKSATKALATMNEQMTPEELVKVILEFHKQSAQMDVTATMMRDAMDNDEDDDVTEKEIEQVLEEIGVVIAQEFSKSCPSCP